MRIPTIVIAIAALTGCTASPNAGLNAPPHFAPHGSASRGEALAQSKCASCHAVGRSGGSPMAAAPAFRSLSQRYPLQDLQEALGEGIVTAHPGMPEFVFQEQEASDLIAYLESISDAR